MAIVEQPPRTLELPPAGVVAPRQTLGVFRRPSATTGWTTLAITSVMTECGFTRLEPMGVCRRTAPSRPDVTTSWVIRTWKPALRRR